MKRQKIILELSNTELNQLMSYINDAERKGWYYGNKKQFDARHLQIKEQIEHSLTNGATDTASHPVHGLPIAVQ